MERSTGLPGLDQLLKGLLPGDNVVWQVESVDAYQPFVEPLCREALKRGRNCIYFRFGRHRPLLEESSTTQIQTLQLHPEEGFETFITAIHRTIEHGGRGAYYVFDSLSGLAVDWSSDRMLGNFFMLTCPYLYDLETIAYFGLIRNEHSQHALQPILETTQIFLDVFQHHNKLFVLPNKVQYRNSSTMYMLHEWNGGTFAPITDSATIAEIMNASDWSGLEPARRQISQRDRAFLEGEKVWAAYRRGEAHNRSELAMRKQLLRMIVSRDEKVLELVETYLTLGDAIEIRNRMIGTGLIGGKAVGMLLARAILRHNDPAWQQRLEPHDSFFLGSDVFYTYLVQNGCWWVRERQRNPKNYLDGSVEARRRILTGQFPDYLRAEFAHLLNYFGQSPIIVRSSSLLEDNFGNAFAGKYDSVFCANQGPFERRMEDFMAAVRAIYASAMSEKALRYRAQRGLLQHDEQMALLIQRVSGSLYGHYFFPQVAGVGLSFNPYVWHQQIDPKAGMVRLVCGLGTRAVDRYDDDYTRVVALNEPKRRPEHNFDEIRQYAQRQVDVIDFEANRQTTSLFSQILQQNHDLPLDMLTTDEDDRTEERAHDAVLTFDPLVSNTDFINHMRQMLTILQEAYRYPVEIEFTLNFPLGGDRKDYRINLLQCRPLQVYGGGTMIQKPKELNEAQIVLEAHGAVIGQSRLAHVDRLIYVVPSIYGKMSLSDRYGVARRIGELVQIDGMESNRAVMLLGPGRWGSTSPNLGVSVSFAEINKVSFLCEIVAMHENLAPEVSLGTHFFNELVESEILYMGLFPKHPENRLREDFFESAPNSLSRLLPDMERWEQAIRVVDVANLPGSPKLKLYANTLEQTVICYLDERPDEPPSTTAQETAGEQSKRPATPDGSPAAD